MKRHLLVVVFTMIILALMGFTSLDGRSSGFIIGAIAGGIGSLIALALFKNEKHRKIATTIIFLAIFFGTKYYIMPYYYAATLDSGLQDKYPIYRTISKYYPNEYETFLEASKKNIVENGSVDVEINYSSELINFATQKSLPFASPRDIYNYLQTNYQIEKRLYTTNPVLVLAIESPARIANQHSLSSLLSSIPENDISAITQAKAALIEAGSKDRKPIQLSDGETKKYADELQQIIASLKEKYGMDEINDTFTATTPFKNPTISAQIILSFYELLLSKGAEKGGNLFKILYLLSIGTPNDKQHPTN